MAPETKSHDEQLAELNAKLDELTKQVAGIKPKRWISIVQAIVVAAAVPITAGVFSTCADRRERELKIYEQNLALVDRAVNFEKDVRYRQAIISYMQVLDDQRPAGYGIGVWLEANQNLLTDQEKRAIEKKKALIDQVEKAGKHSQKVSAELSAELEATAKKVKLTDEDVLAIAEKVETLEADLSTAIDAQQQLVQVQQVLGEPIAPPPALERNLVPMETADQLGEWVVQFSTDRKLLAAEHEALVLAGLDIDVRIYFTTSHHYVTVAGPYPTRGAALKARDEIARQRERTLMVRRLETLCPSATPLPRAEQFEVLVCSKLGEEATPIRRLMPRESASDVFDGL